MTVGVAVITHRAKHHLSHCLPPWLNSPLRPKVLVVNSSSEDGTVEEATRLGAETLVIPRNHFNHGSTRELARQHLKTDIVVMTTPDAYPRDPHTLEALIAPLRKGTAAITYARQIPHDGADVFEAFPREFNYPATSHTRSLKDAKKYGAYTFFCSDSCAAYLNKALDQVGGFPPVLIGEDTVVTALLLKQGHHISYVAEAVVKHSHRYTLRQEFQRYFDTGLARADYRSLLTPVSEDEKRGLSFFSQFLLRLATTQPFLIPYAILQTACKWTGFHLGCTCVHAPVWLRRGLSGQDFYWTSKDFIGVK